MPRAVSAALLLLTAPAAFSQRPGATPPPAPVTSTSRILLTGGGLHDEAFVLPKFHGDWFATAADAHASLTLNSQPPAHPLTLSLQWDGKRSTIAITGANNTDVGGNHVSFFLTMSGPAPYNFSARPGGTDVVTLTVARMDDRDLDARLSGAAGLVRISGNITLHRDAPPAPATTGTYHDCDNVIHDKLVGAEARSPSDCEVKFDAAVRRTFQQAFRPVIDSFSATGWVIDKQPSLGPIALTARHTEANPYRIDHAQEGPYQFSLGLNPAGAEYARYQNQMQQAITKAAEAFKAGVPNGSAVNDLTNAAREMQGATNISVSAVINFPSIEVVNFKGEHTVLPLPGASWAVFVPYAQAPTGGDVDASHSVTFIFLGAWSAPSVEKLRDGGEHIRLNAAFDKTAPTLAVQNIRVRIQASLPKTQSLLKQIDWTAIQSLLRR